MKKTYTDPEFNIFLFDPEDLIMNDMSGGQQTEPPVDPITNPDSGWTHNY